MWVVVVVVDAMEFFFKSVFVQGNRGDKPLHVPREGLKEDVIRRCIFWGSTPYSGTTPYGK